MSKPALLLTDEFITESDRRIEKVLKFFGIGSLKLTTTNLISNIVPEGPQSEQYRILCSAEIFLKICRDWERQADFNQWWLKKVHSVFVYQDDNAAAIYDLHRYFTGIVPLPPDTTGSFTVTNKLGRFCGPLSGLRVATSGSVSNATLVCSLFKNEAVDIISTKTGATFLGIEYAGVPVFVSTSTEVVDIDAELRSQNFDVRDHFLAAVPIVLYIKWAFEHTCWGAPETNACLVIDDPVLKPTHGFIDFEKLLFLMKDRGFSTNVAFIPWNWRRSSPEVTQMIAENARYYSLSIHGCDHIRAEFGDSDANRLYSRVKQAIERMDRHQSTTGICHDRVMVFPQGVFSEAAMAALKRTDLIAAVNNDVISADPNQRPMTISELWDTAVMRYSMFPIFTRRYPWEGVENFAFDILLGKPAIIVIHHDFCRDRYRHLLDFIDRFNALECQFAWRSLGEVVRRSFRQRELSPELVEVRMYGTELRLENRSSIPRRFLIRRPESQPSDIEEIRADSRPVKWDVSGGFVRFEIELNPAESAVIRVRFRDLMVNGASNDTMSYRIKTRLRRHLCEIRDNYIATGKYRLANLFSA